MWAGLCWFAFALLVGFCLVQYVSNVGGAGFIDLKISGGALIGLVHIGGFFAAMGLCLIVGIGLCARGLAFFESGKDTRSVEPRLVSARLDASSVATATAESSRRCVRCDKGLSGFINICPECGWTQPFGELHQADDSASLKVL
jgi:hypothetical protein